MLTISRPTGADFDEWLKTAAEMEEYYPGLNIEKYARTLNKAAGAGKALAANLDGAFAGGALFAPEKPELDFLMVAPWARRRGVGRQLVEAVLARVRAGAWLNVETYRPGDLLGEAARPFYEKLGFVKRGEGEAHDHPVEVMAKFKPLMTKRLYIRPFMPSDLSAYTENVLGIPEFPVLNAQRERARDFMDWQITSAVKMDVMTGAVCMGVFDRETHALMGFCGLGEHDDLHVPEVFYGLQTPYRGKGYAAEACREVTRWGLEDLGLNEIVGTAETGNAASRRTLEKCGYALRDSRELTVHAVNEKYDFAIYAIKRDG